jgi:uncharacterized membrane protein YvbJ
MIVMVFCSNCGKELPEDAYFCPRCGVKTRTGVKAGVSTPWENMKDAFSKMGKEIEKAFSIAGTEMEKAFKKAKDEITKATGQEPIACLHCGAKNLADARFCYKCGKELNE